MEEGRASWSLIMCLETCGHIHIQYFTRTYTHKQHISVKKDTFTEYVHAHIKYLYTVYTVCVCKCVKDSEGECVSLHYENHNFLCTIFFSIFNYYY